MRVLSLSSSLHLRRVLDTDTNCTSPGALPLPLFRVLRNTREPYALSDPASTASAARSTDTFDSARKGAGEVAEELCGTQTALSTQHALGALLALLSKLPLAAGVCAGTCERVLMCLCMADLAEDKSDPDRPSLSRPEHEKFSEQKRGQLDAHLQAIAAASPTRGAFLPRLVRAVHFFRQPADLTALANFVTRVLNHEWARFSAADHKAGASADGLVQGGGAVPQLVQECVLQLLFTIKAARLAELVPVVVATGAIPAAANSADGNRGGLPSAETLAASLDLAAHPSPALALWLLTVFAEFGQVRRAATMVCVCVCVHTCV